MHAGVASWGMADDVKSELFFKKQSELWSLLPLGVESVDT